jgi:hypothetical protein
LSDDNDKTIDFAKALSKDFQASNNFEQSDLISHLYSLMKEYSEFTQDFLLNVVKDITGANQHYKFMENLMNLKDKFTLNSFNQFLITFNNTYVSVIETIRKNK